MGGEEVLQWEERRCWSGIRGGVTVGGEEVLEWEERMNGNGKRGHVGMGREGVWEWAWRGVSETGEEVLEWVGETHIVLQVAVYSYFHKTILSYFLE